MKKALFFILIPILLFSLENKLYKVGVISDWEPYYSLDKNKNPTGFAIELFNEIAKESNLKFKYIVFDDWTELFQPGMENKVDLIPNLGITKKRSKHFAFSQPTDTFYISLFKRKDSKNINSNEDILDKKIGVYINNVCNSLIDKKRYKNKVVFDREHLMLNALKSKEIDVLCHPKMMIDEMLKKSHNNIESFGKPIKEIRRGVAVSKNYFELLPVIDEAITTIKISGKHKEIYFKWFGYGNDTLFSKEQLKYLVIGIVVIFIFFISFVLWDRRLRLELEKQKLLKLQLEKSRKKYEIIFKRSSTVSFLVDPVDGAIVDANESALKFYGYDLKEITNLTIFDINTLSEDILKNKMQNIKTDCKYFEFKHILSNKDIRDVRVFSSPIEIDGRKLLHSQIFDITEQKENESKLQQALLVFENTNDGITITDKDANIINVNNAFTQTTGYRKEEVLGLNPNILRSKVNSNSFYEDMWNSIKGQGFWRGEIVNRHKSGKDYYEILTINTLFDSQKNVTGYIGIFSDISKQKDDERIILQQSKVAAVGEMLGNISHQWRQPLSIITTHATGLKLAYDFEEEVEKEKVMNTMDMINSQAQYLSKTIDDFRNFFSGDSSEKKDFDLRESFEKINSLTQDSFKNNFITYSIDIEDHHIFGNENIFIQAFINIYNNAKDALSTCVKNTDFRYFDVNIYKENKNLIIELKDSAGGVPENILNKIFEPYFTTKHKSVGTGIGLYMTNQIITKQFNGNISVENCDFIKDDKTFKGALFRIAIPMS